MQKSLNTRWPILNSHLKTLGSRRQLQRKAPERAGAEVFEHALAGALRLALELLGRDGQQVVLACAAGARRQRGHCSPHGKVPSCVFFRVQVGGWRPLLTTLATTAQRTV